MRDRLGPFQLACFDLAAGGRRSRLRSSKSDEGQESIPVDARIFHQAMGSKGEEAYALAARRLRPSGKPPLVSRLPVSGRVAQRTAAALPRPTLGSLPSRRGGSETPN
jgi:hypothetical protein